MTQSTLQNSINDSANNSASNNSSGGFQPPSTIHHAQPESDASDKSDMSDASGSSLLKPSADASAEGTMTWSRLISDMRLGLEDFHDERRGSRSDFQRDYDRLVFSSPFRRLQNKTQVFPLPGSIFVHNRLTHSIEVACVGRSLANDIAASLRTRHPDVPADTFEAIGEIVPAASPTTSATRRSAIRAKKRLPDSSPKAPEPTCAANSPRHNGATLSTSRATPTRCAC